MSDKCSVLVADENRDAADAHVVLLRALGHRALAAYGGVQAHETCLDFHPDLAILDVQVPYKDGRLAAVRMRAHQFPPKIIATLTRRPHDQEPRRSLAGVFDGHLSKPCEMQELDDLLERGQRACDEAEAPRRH